MYSDLFSFSFLFLRSHSLFHSENKHHIICMNYVIVSNLRKKNYIDIIRVCLDGGNKQG